ncbi:hypothetical protein CHS0354_042936 [Potamilus streckersoni]|uniref:Uncharacterized protein n=1 Tax=Potamilus streckersoni TaxID=2493646 RepID=A0AAE0T500_9BIVA|nr:hypothetical protein CHS0354_042936 [Potamilus streckersoni]
MKSNTVKSTTTPIPTTTLPPPPIPFDWTPVIAALCSVFGVVALCWCCWRPGYLPWRLARLRNVPCINTPVCRLCRGRTRYCTCCEACMGDSTDTWDTASVLAQGGNYEQLNKHRSFRVGSDAIGPKVHVKPSFGSLGMAAMFIGGHHGSVGSDIFSPRHLNGVSNGVGYINDLGNMQIKNGRVHPSPVQQSLKQISPALSQSTYSDLSTNWLNLLTGDGGHLREQR